MDIILLGLLVAYIIYKLYNILGKIDEENIYYAKIKKNTGLKNIIDIEEVNVKEVTKKSFTNKKEDAALAVLENELLKKNVELIKKYDNKFLLYDFIEKVEKVFDLLLSNFFKGDPKKIEKLLSKDLYKNLLESLQDLSQKNISRNVTLISVDKVCVTDITLEEIDATHIAYITVNIISKQIIYVKNLDTQEIIEGDINKTIELSDNWVFSKKLDPTEIIWKVVKL